MAAFDTISITEYTEMYDRLVKKIEELVADTQKHGEYRSLPSIIVMTKRQQKMLRRYPMMKQMHGTKQRMWITDQNVMEVTLAELP